MGFKLADATKAWRIRRIRGEGGLRFLLAELLFLCVEVFWLEDWATAAGTKT